MRRASPVPNGRAEPPVKNRKFFYEEGKLL
jgi:hypothetical protein